MKMLLILALICYSRMSLESTVNSFLFPSMLCFWWYITRQRAYRHSCLGRAPISRVTYIISGQSLFQVRASSHQPPRRQDVYIHHHTFYGAAYSYLWRHMLIRYDEIYTKTPLQHFDAASRIDWHTLPRQAFIDSLFSIFPLTMMNMRIMPAWRHWLVSCPPPARYLPFLLQYKSPAYAAERY